MDFSAARRLVAGALAGAVVFSMGPAMGHTHSKRRARKALAYVVSKQKANGSIVAFSCYVWLIRNAPTSLVSTYAFVNPVVAVTLGAIILNEPLTPRTIFAGGIIVVAVALIVWSQKGAPGLTGAEAEESVRAASGE